MKTFTKWITCVTLLCFVFTSNFSQGLYALIDRQADTAKVKSAIDDFVIPYSYGRITDAKIFNSDQVVVNIQDLHCHPEVQKNIANILAALDQEYGLNDVYLEGAHGRVDTSWLCNIKDKELKKEIVENLIDQGKLTGSEYYSVRSNRPDLLKGIEDESIHKANIIRLGKILEKKGYFEKKIKELDKDLEFMKARYFSSRNRDFDRLIEKHRTGKISSEQYYRLLAKYAQTINKDQEKFNTILAVSMDNYPNIKTYLELTQVSKQLKYKRISRQLQELLGALKLRIPYAAYNSLLEEANNWTMMGELYLRLAHLSDEYHVDLQSSYPDLKKFFEYTEKNRNLNPIKLIDEEKKLTAEIRTGLSKNISELKVSFLADFYPYFQDYLLNRLSAEDYEYFRQKFDEFNLDWGKYAFKNRIIELSEDFTLLDEFYETNCERNNCFLKNIAEIKDVRGAECEVQGNKERGEKEGENLTISDLLAKSEIIVIVAGGFHSKGLDKLLRERKISYLTITPNVTQDTAISNAIYAEFAKYQAKILSNALALGVASQLSSPALFELEIKAANNKLREAGITDKIKLVEAIEESCGIKPRYDARTGMITFDNGAQIRLEDDENGAIVAKGIKISDSLSEAIKGSIAALINVKELRSALLKAQIGQSDDIIKLFLAFAAQHYLIDGNGLPYIAENDPELLSADVISGIQKEILARFPEPVAAAIAESQRNENALDTVAKRSDWLKIILAVDFLRGYFKTGEMINKRGRPFVSGKSPDDARKVIETPEMQKVIKTNGGYFTLNEYLSVYGEVQERFHFTAPSDQTSSESTFRTDLRKLAGNAHDNYLQILKSKGVNRYYVNPKYAKTYGEFGFNPALDLKKDSAIRKVFHQVLERRYDTRVLSERFGIGTTPQLVTYQRHGISLSDYVEKMIEFMVNHAEEDPHVIAAKFREAFPDMANPPELTASLTQWVRHQKISEFDLKILIDAIPSGSIIGDIGAGHNALGLKILEYSDEKNLRIKNVVGTDINDWQDEGRKLDDRLLFVHQPYGTRIPVPSNSLDAIIVKWVLHHMTLDDQRAFVESLSRMLKPGGRIIVFDALGSTEAQKDEIVQRFEKELLDEKFWPKGSYTEDYKRLTYDFLELNPKQQNVVNALEDYFGHNLSMGRDFMPQYFTYRPFSEFQELFESIGLQENKDLRRVFGSMPIMKAGPPSIRFVYEKPVTRTTVHMGDGGESKILPFSIQGLLEHERKYVSDVLSTLVYSDTSKDELLRSKVNDVVILGNSRLDTFAEALELVDKGIAHRIVVLGGYGEATLTLIDKAVEQGYEIKISEKVTARKTSWRYYKRVIAADNRRTIIKFDESKIIAQILEQMLKKGNFPNARRIGNVIVAIGGSDDTNRLFSKYRMLLDDEGAFNTIGGYKIVFLQNPYQQLRAKAKFDSAFSSELLQGKVQTISHTVSYQNMPNDKLTAFRQLIGEAWRIFRYSEYGLGYINLRNKQYPRGIRDIPQQFWSSANHLFESLDAATKQKLAHDLVLLVEHEKLTLDLSDLPGDNYALREFAKNIYDTNSPAKFRTSSQGFWNRIPVAGGILARLTMYWHEGLHWAADLGRGKIDIARGEYIPYRETKFVALFAPVASIVLGVSLLIASYALGVEQLPSASAAAVLSLGGVISMTDGVVNLLSGDPDSDLHKARALVRKMNTEGKKSSTEGLLFWPQNNFAQGSPLDMSLIRPARSSRDVLELLKHAKQKGIPLSITGHLRGIDGAGSSLDLPEFQKALTRPEAKAIKDLPSTPTIASEFTVKVRFELAADPEAIEYVAPDYGITKENPYVVKGEIKLDSNGRTPKGQLDGPAYIFHNIFGLKGVRIICEEISPMALAGGMESSNVFNIALIASASMLSGADLSQADIFSLAVKLENDEFGGITGGQGHLCGLTGGAYRHLWLSGVRDAQGELTNPYAAFSVPILSDQQLSRLEEHTMLVQSGKEYENGKAKMNRTASLVGKMWLDLLRDKDAVGFPLHEEKIGLTEKFIASMQAGDFGTLVATIDRYVDIREQLSLRWINLMLDTHQGKDVPEYARKYAQKVFDENHPEYRDYEVLRQMLKTHGAGIRNISLYSLDPIVSLINEARTQGIAIMPLGAGGPGANLVAFSPRGQRHLRKFMESQGLGELKEQEVRRIVKGTGILKGYMPFISSKERMKFEGFRELGLSEPRQPRREGFEQSEYTSKLGYEIRNGMKRLESEDPQTASILRERLSLIAPDDEDALRYLNEDIQWFLANARSPEGIYFNPGNRKNPKVSVVILHYGNSPDDTIRALTNLSRSTYTNFDVILIDNNSPDCFFEKYDHLPIPAEIRNRITVIHRAVNLGYTGGNNLGARIALQSGADYVLFFNNDSLIEKDGIQKMVDAIRGESLIGVVQPSLYLCNDSVQMDEISKTGLLSPDQRALAVEKTRAFTDNLVKQGNASSVGTSGNLYYKEPSLLGTVQMVRSDVIRLSGLFDTRLFMFTDEPNVGYRYFMTGLKKGMITDVFVLHPPFAVVESPKIYGEYLMWRNRIFNAEQLYPRGKFGRRILATEAYMGIRFLEDNDNTVWGKIKDIGRDDIVFLSIFKGIADGLLGHFSPTRERSDYDETRQISAYEEKFAHMTSFSQLFDTLLNETDPYQSRLMIWGLHKAHERIHLIKPLTSEQKEILIELLQRHVYTWRSWITAPEHSTTHSNQMREAFLRDVRHISHALADGNSEVISPAGSVPFAITAFGRLTKFLACHDVKRDSRDVDVLIICGHEDLRVFEESWDLIKNKKVKRRVIITGGHGKGTSSLVRSAISAGLINEEDRAKSEAEIIFQIIQRLAERDHVDIQGIEFKLDTRARHTLENMQFSRDLMRDVLDEYRAKSIHQHYRPLKVGYTQIPVAQYRTKATFNSVFKAELDQRIIQGVNYTVNFDLVPQFNADELYKETIREMWRLIIYSGKGDILPEYDGEKGLQSIPSICWKDVLAMIKESPEQREILDWLKNMALNTMKDYSADDWINRLPSDLYEENRDSIEIIIRQVFDQSESSGKVDNRMILPDNLFLVKQWKREGKTKWWIAKEIAKLELEDTLKPVAFYRAHYQGENKYKGGRTRRVIGVALITVAMYTGFALGFVSGGISSFSLKAAQETSIRAGYSANIYTHAVYNMIIDAYPLTLKTRLEKVLKEQAGRRQVRDDTVYHIVDSKSLLENIEKYKNESGHNHVWLTDLPNETVGELFSVGCKVNVLGTSDPIDVWIHVEEGAFVFCLDLKKAGVSEAAYGAIMRQGAAQIASYLGGTDIMEGDEAAAQHARDVGLAGHIQEASKIDFKPVIVVDHTNNPESVQRYFSNEGVNKSVFVSADELEKNGNAEIGVTTENRLIRHRAMAVTMGENKILKMDIASIEEFIKALGLFNAVGNGQMLVDWEIFAKALTEHRITEEALRQLLADARKRGVAIHVEYRAADAGAEAVVKRLVDMKFQGVSLDLTALENAAAVRVLSGLKEYPLIAVAMPGGMESPAPKRTVTLSEVRGMKFGADEVLDVEIPAGLTKEQIREQMAYLPLANTMIFHSADAARLIGATRDIVNRKVFASLLNILLNFGKREIATPEKARRLGYNFEAGALPVLRAGEAGQKQIMALSEKPEEALLNLNSAVFEQVQELSSPELKAAFLRAIAEKMLIRAKLTEANKELAADYESGKYRFSTPQHEEMLGSALLAQYLMTPEEREQDRLNVASVKENVQYNLNSFLIKLSSEVRDGKAQTGAITAIVDIILMDLLMDYRLKKSNNIKDGTMDIRKTNSILSAA